MGLLRGLLLLIRWSFLGTLLGLPCPVARAFAHRLLWLQIAVGLVCLGGIAVGLVCLGVLVCLGWIAVGLVCLGRIAVACLVCVAGLLFLLVFLGCGGCSLCLTLCRGLRLRFASDTVHDEKFVQQCFNRAASRF